MKIAVEGCCHGELDKIYETVSYLEKFNNIKIDLLLICGDFQAVRNRSDLETMAVPPKYRKMNTFWKYYAGIKTAPILTVIIGGNHEASSYMQELPYGGWLAPNIYYLGYSGVIQCGGIRIGGLSGIYKGKDYNRGHFEHPPYTEETKRSCYHIRNIEVFRLKQIQQPIDIFISHDWPRGIYDHGNVQALLSRKAFFRSEIENGTLGSLASEELLNHLKPKYWFAAHLHCKFAALVTHKDENEETKETKFLALDKCLPKRKFLQVIDIPSDSSKSVELELDPEWLAILKSTNHLLSLSRSNYYMPGLGSPERYDFTPTPEEIDAICEDFGGIFKIPENFERTAKPFDPKSNEACPPQIMINPQTTLLCEMLALTDPFAVFCGKQKPANYHSTIQSPASDLTSLDDSALVDDSDLTDSTIDLTTVNSTLEMSNNPDEISIDDIDENDNSDVPDNEEGSAINPECPSLSLPSPKYYSEELDNKQIVSSLDINSVDIKESSPSALLSTDDCNRKLNASFESDSSVSSGKRSASVDTDTQSSVTGDESSPVKTKKFKRRNQAMYSNNDES